MIYKGEIHTGAKLHIFYSFAENVSSDGIETGAETDS